MEGLMCKALAFEFCIPSSYVFLNRYSRLDSSMCSYNSKEYFMARYLLEISMLDTQYLQFKQSNLAASAIYLANKIYRKDNCWNELLVKHAEYTEK